MDLYEQPLLPLFICKKYKVKSLKAVSILFRQCPFLGLREQGDSYDCLKAANCLREISNFNKQI